VDLHGLSQLVAHGDQRVAEPLGLLVQNLALPALLIQAAALLLQTPPPRIITRSIWMRSV
jgi:hypothetical protein